MSRSRVLLDALRAADPSLPDALVTFDRVTGSRDPEPDFVEWSARLSDVCDPARLTYYFDVARRGATVARTAGARFVSLAGALGADVPGALAEALERSVPHRPEVLQLVLGIDHGMAAARRVKLYAVLCDAAPLLVDSLIAAAGGARPPALDAERVYILGFDFGANGLLDAKLYYRLDRTRLARVVADLDSVDDLVEGTREVVLQRCTRSDRSQIYFHATAATVIQGHLARRARDEPVVAELVDRHAAAASRLARGRLEPWIVSFGLQGNKLRLEASTIYFHLVGADAP